MKKAMKYTILARALLILLALSLLTGAAALPTGAMDTESAFGEFVTWEYFPSSQFINGKDPATGEVYRLSPITTMPSRIQFMPNKYYHYANKVSIEGISSSLRAPKHGGDFVMLYDGTVMASNAGKQFLNKVASYGSGFFSEYRLTDGSLYSTLTEDSLKVIANTYGKHEELVRYTLFDLRNIEPYVVYGFMDDGWFGVPVAFIYELEDGLYFADPTRLADDCFDGEGKLRPKTGVSLSLYPLDEEQTDEAYDGIRRIGYKSPYHSYEDPSQQIGYINDIPSTADTYASVIFLGILFPVAPITVGLCLPRSERFGYKNRWKLLAVLGGAWMALGILTLVLTIVSM